MTHDKVETMRDVSGAEGKTKNLYREWHQALQEMGSAAKNEGTLIKLEAFDAVIAEKAEEALENADPALATNYDQLMSGYGSNKAIDGDKQLDQETKAQLMLVLNELQQEEDVIAGFFNTKVSIGGINALIAARGYIHRSEAAGYHSKFITGPEGWNEKVWEKKKTQLFASNESYDMLLKDVFYGSKFFSAYRSISETGDGNITFALKLNAQPIGTVEEMRDGNISQIIIQVPLHLGEKIITLIKKDPINAIRIVQGLCAITDGNQPYGNMRYRPFEADRTTGVIPKIKVISGIKPLKI